MRNLLREAAKKYISHSVMNYKQMPFLTGAVEVLLLITMPYV